MSATHPFVPSGRFKISSIGRRLEYCDYPDCGKVRLGKSHEPIGKRSALVKAHVAGFVPESEVMAPEPMVEAPRPEPEPPRPEPWQLGMLRDSIAHALTDLPKDTLGWRLYYALLDVNKALINGADDLPLMRDPVVDEPLPPAAPKQPTWIIRNSQRRSNRKLIRSLKDNWHDLAERALDEGWSVEKTGGGHLRFKRNDGGPEPSMIVIPASPGEGRGYQNARAQFKRLGLNVEGL